jgi:Gpi18-like mannosyltransferase
VSELYLIKLLSVIADLFLARAIAVLVLKTTGSEKRALAAFAAALALPTMFINGAVWGQCDSIFTALALWGLFCALDAKPIRAALLFGLALAFKLQSVFILPVLLPLIFTKKLKIYHLPLVPAAYLAAVSPAIIAGRDIVETLLIYLRQGEGGAGSLNYNSPSVFSLPLGVTEPETARIAAIAGIAAAFAFCLGLFAFLFLRRKRLGSRALLLAAFLFSCGIPLLLPHMHERYFFIADCLSLALAFSAPQSAIIAPLVSFASLSCYYAYFARTWLILPYWGFFALLIALLSAFALLAAESK